jgi:hypothetical protein
MFLQLQHLRCGSRSGVEAFEPHNSLVDVDLLHLRGLAANQGFEASSISELKMVSFLTYPSSETNSKLSVN